MTHPLLPAGWQRDQQRIDTTGSRTNPSDSHRLSWPTKQDAQSAKWCVHAAESDGEQSDNRSGPIRSNRAG